LQKDEPAQGGNALDKLSGTGGGFDIFLLKNFCRVAPIVSNLGDIAFSPQVGFSPYNTTISQLCKISLTISNLLASIISLMRMGGDPPPDLNLGTATLKFYFVGVDQDPFTSAFLSIRLGGKETLRR
jgi:hypothetical protein